MFKFKLFIVFSLIAAGYYYLFLRDIQDHSNICSIYEAKPTWEYTLDKVENKSNISKHLILSIMKQESAFKSNAKPPRKKLFWIIPSWNRISTSEGYSQAINGTWDNYKLNTKNDSADRNSFTDSAEFIAWYLNRSIKTNGIKREDYYNLYLSYHEGHGGFNKKSYNKKPFLLKVAKKVERIAKKYEKNQNKC
jgi:hypothetical protein